MTVFDLVVALSPPCADTPDLFYTDDICSILEAKAICHQCPVVIPCLTAALRSEERFGVWGGMTPAERQELRQPA